MTDVQQAVPVAQEDREAAAALDDALGFLTDLERPIVEQAFARHRLPLPCKSGEGAEASAVCPSCEGSGIGHSAECWPCGGSGKVHALRTDATQTREANEIERQGAQIAMGLIVDAATLGEAQSIAASFLEGAA